MIAFWVQNCWHLEEKKFKSYNSIRSSDLGGYDFISGYNKCNRVFGSDWVIDDGWVSFKIYDNSWNEEYAEIENDKVLIRMKFGWFLWKLSIITNNFLLTQFKIISFNLQT